jgi:hypothetical protein
MIKTLKFEYYLPFTYSVSSNIQSLINKKLNYHSFPKFKK